MSEIQRYDYYESCQRPISGVTKGYTISGIKKDERGDYVKYSDHIAALADLKAQLAALQWTPITESNPVTSKDEIASKDFKTVVMASRLLRKAWKGYYYRRPINAPKEQSNG